MTKDELIQKINEGSSELQNELEELVHDEYSNMASDTTNSGIDFIVNDLIETFKFEPDDIWEIINE